MTAAPEAVGPAAASRSAVGSGLIARGLALSASLTAIVVAMAIVIRAIEAPATSLAWLQPLVAAGALCLGLLLRRAAPALAWSLLVVGSLVASTVPIDLMQAVNAEPRTFAAWLPPAIAVAVSSILTVVTAALYSTRRDRRLGPWVGPVVVGIAAWLAGSLVLVIVLVAAGARSEPGFTWADAVTLPTFLYQQLVLVLLGLGVAGDVRRAMSRADARATGAGGAGVERWRLVLDELLPGAVERHDRDVEAERMRLAGDLHAAVLPSLRRAIAEAESGAGPEALAARLRTVDLELERLLADRWPVVLQTFGLVPALEDLAERFQQEDCTIDIDVGRAERTAARVEAAAFRVAQLALDNAARHASARHVAIDVDVAPASLRLTIADDGRGIDPEAAGRSSRSGARGWLDQQRQAAAVGATVVIGRSEAGGTAVSFSWSGASGTGSSSAARDG